MSILKIIAYPAIIEKNEDFSVRKTSPMEILNSVNVMVKTLEDIEYEVDQFGHKTFEKHPEISFAIDIIFARGEAKIRGFDKAKKENKFGLEQWVKIITH